MKIRSYEVGSLIGETDTYRLYTGESPDGEVLIKVAKTFEDIDYLSEESRFFRNLSVMSDDVERVRKQNGGDALHYDWLFAKLIESWCEASQGSRMINVYQMPEVKLDELIPLSKLMKQTYVDVRTSVWVLGKIFKLYSFFELISDEMDIPFVQYTEFSTANYLVEPEHHRLILMNHEKEVRNLGGETYRLVRKITSEIIPWIVPGNGEEDEEYMNLLRDFSDDGRYNFEVAHKDLYTLVRKLWGIEYYPFTYKIERAGIWRTITEKPFSKH